MENENFEIPCEFNDIIKFSFDNLVKYLKFYNDTSKKTTLKINDVQNKINELVELKHEIKELFETVEIMKRKDDSLEISISNHQSKILDFEKNLNEYIQKFKEFSVNIESVEERVNINNGLISNLSKEQSEIKFHNEKANSNLNSLKSESDTIKLSVEKNSDDIIKIYDFKKYVDQKLLKNKEKRKGLFELNKKSQSRIEDLEFHVNKLYSLIKPQNEKQIEIPILDDKIQSNNHLINDEISRKSNEHYPETNITIKPYNEEIKEKKYLKELNELKEKMNFVEKEIKEYKRRNSKIEFAHIPVNNEIESKTEDLKNDSNFELPKLKEDPGSDQNPLIEMINKLNDHVKFMEINFKSKPNREEVEKSIKNIYTEIEKNQLRSHDNLSKMESKLKTTPFTINNDEKNDNLKEEIRKFFQENGLDIISREITRIIGEEIPLNENVKSLFLIAKSNKDEIDKLNKVLYEIRGFSSLSSMNLGNEDNMGKFYQDTNLKITEFQEKLDRIAHVVDDTFKETNETEFDPNSRENIKEYIKVVSLKTKQISERLDKIQVKQDNLNFEILTKLKKDLSADSNKILDEFRFDLKSSISRIEDQLREKVDHFNLDESIRKIDNKYSNEISKKIDKNDMKIHNSKINKKLDIFENKISKTLVDTLIDLQMEETPLIIKKGTGNDKCGSCNQAISQVAHMHNFNVTSTNFINNSVGIDENLSRFKLRMIQDNANKFGTGGISKVLGNLDNSNNIVEDLKTSYDNYKNHNNVPLPDIKRKSAVTSPKRLSRTKFLNKIDEVNEKETNILAEDDNKDKKERVTYKIKSKIK